MIHLCYMPRIDAREIWSVDVSLGVILDSRREKVTVKQYMSLQNMNEVWQSSTSFQTKPHLISLYSSR